jgi:hypothetical protein
VQKEIFGVIPKLVTLRSKSVRTREHRYLSCTLALLAFACSQSPSGRENAGAGMPTVDGATGPDEAGGSGGSAGMGTQGDIAPVFDGTAGTSGDEATGAGGDSSVGAPIEPVACEARDSSSDAVSIAIDGSQIATDNRNGLTFKGFGVLSANGTSALLLDYKAMHPEQYGELLQTLFGGSHPIMSHVKIEMGNDRNNSTGPDAASMRLANESPNVQRVPGFQLAADAKKWNPELRVSVLRWSAPGWVTTNDDVYTWFKQTILAAYRTYGFMVDYVNPGINERGADLVWSRQYAERVRSDNTGFNDDTERSLYNGIKVVISDEAGVGSFGGAMVNDVALREAVAVAGYHYSTEDDGGGNFKRLAEQFDKEVWNSEAQATFGNTSFRPNNNTRDPSIPGTGIGGLNGPLEMGNTIVKGFVNSRRTHFIYQPAIGSFYEGGQFSFKELLSARDPWSGWVHYDAGLEVLRHFVWFAKVGWENADNTAGIWRVLPGASSTGATGSNPVNGRNGTPSYLTLASPDARHFSTVLVNDSERIQTYRLEPVNMALADNQALELWETRAADAGEAFNGRYLRYLCNQTPEADGTYVITVRPYSALTATTRENTQNPELHLALPVEGPRAVLDTDATGLELDSTDDILYADDFDYSQQVVPRFAAGGEIAGDEPFVASRGGAQGTIARYLSARNGAFEVVLPSGSDNYVLRQQVDQPSMGLGDTWNNGNPIAAIGDNRWLNYRASVDVSFENGSTQNGANYAAIGARQQGGANSHDVTGTPYLLKFSFDGTWQLLIDGEPETSGNVVTGAGGVTIAGFDAAPDEWHELALEVADNRVTALLDGVVLTTFSDPNPRLSGRVDLASGYYPTQFDNLRVEKLAGYPAYYSEVLDDLEMHDLSATPARRLIYGGDWAHENGKTMYNYQRSLSTSRAAGATLEYSFVGTGLDLLGPNNGSATLEISVDGQVTQPSVNSRTARELYQTFTLRGLSAANHTVVVKVLSGTLVLDAIGVVQ